MDQLNRTVVQRGTGVPGEVAVLETGPVPVPGSGEVLVELVIAPINPAELLMFEGAYGYRDTVPPVPRMAGIEGVGRVVGGDVTPDVPLGALVSLAGTPAVFSDYRVLPTAGALVLDTAIDPEVFALSFVNVQAVLLMLREWPELESGDWIIQNAGNSAYARVLDAAAARRGLNVLNVVRSETAAAGTPGTVLIDGDAGSTLDERVRAATGGVRPRVAVDAIGGAATGRLAETLQPGGRVVTYGLLSGEPARLDTRLLVFNDIHVEGFWLPRTMSRTDPSVLSSVAAEALDLIRTTPLALPIDARYPLADIAAALTHAAAPHRSGKIVVTR